MAYWIFIITVSIVSIVCAAGIVRPELTDRLFDEELPKIRRRLRMWLRDRWIDRTAGRLAAEGLIVVRAGEARPIERDASCLQVVEAYYEQQK